MSTSRTPGRDLEAAGAADDEIALHAGFAHRLKEERRIACGVMDGADHRVVAFDERDQPRLVVDVALDGGHAGQGRDLFRVARDGGDCMPAGGEFGENARAGLAGGADEGDFHVRLLCGMVSIPGIGR